jgi:hypothetical protein
MRRWLRILGDTRLTWWSLCATAVLFFVGAIFANARYELFNRLNETRIQDWIGAHLLDDLAVAWWLPLLLLALLVLGINTAACTVERVANLWPARRDRPPAAFLRDLTPSVIHAQFAVVMIGHLLTITGGTWQRVPLREGRRIALPGTDGLVVEGLRIDLSRPSTGQESRVTGTTATLASADGETLQVAFGAPASYRGYHLLLDRPKKQKKDPPKTGADADENCNREKDFRAARADQAGTTQLLVVDDPGLWVIFPAFGLILVLMGWYFAVPVKRNRGS